MKFNKLVRDKIPEIIARGGKKAVTRTLTDWEYKYYLDLKLDEEVKEFHESKTAEELADILEVVFALGCANGYNKADILNIADCKRCERGGFDKKILLIETKEKDNDR